DIREHLPAADAVKIPDGDNPWQECGCVRDLPLDDQHGPYPVVLFVHGTAAFRTQSLTFMTHWASRGFVVVAADHPGIQLKDVLASPIGLPGSSDQSGDATKMLAALSTPSGDLAFLAGHLDQARLALSGHSAGGGAIAGFGNQAQVLIPMASGGTKAGSALVSSLIMGAGNDGIASYSNVQSGYSSSPKKKRLVGLGGNAGHLAFSDLCAIGASGGGILQIAQNHGVMVPALIAALSQDGCKAGQLPPPDGWHIVNFASSAVLEETLQCSSTSAASVAMIKTAVPNVQEYQQEP
ncbi:MAG: alpha/beta hydrolase, partial [Usitatibacter sp.]